MPHPDPEEKPAAGGAQAPKKSYGNMSADHWSRARQGSNEEALEYYRQRSQAPGVREGGGPRNFYCMECDGVIPSDGGATECPHCGAALEGGARRYFNWVELDRPPPSDLRALLPVAGAVALGLTLLVLALLWFLR